MYQPPQYAATTTRRGQRLHGFMTNHCGDWKPALITQQYREGYDRIFNTKEVMCNGKRKAVRQTETEAGQIGKGVPVCTKA